MLIKRHFFTRHRNGFLKLKITFFFNFLLIFSSEVLRLSTYSFNYNKSYETIYHHQGTVEGGSKRIDVGDKVDFSLDKHDGREVAIQIAVLPRSFPIGKA